MRTEHSPIHERTLYHDALVLDDALDELAEAGGAYSPLHVLDVIAAAAQGYGVAVDIDALCVQITPEAISQRAAELAAAEGGDL